MAIPQKQLKQYRALLKEVAPVREYGPDYDRGVDYSAFLLEEAIEKDRKSGAFTFFTELRVRYDFLKRQRERLRPNPSDKLRDEERPSVLGYELDRESLTPKRSKIDTSAPGDYGADPLGEIDGEFRWRMVSSGDIVNAEERERRLRKKNPKSTRALKARLLK